MALKGIHFFLQKKNGDQEHTEIRTFIYIYEDNRERISHIFHFLQEKSLKLQCYFPCKLIF